MEKKGFFKCTEHTVYCLDFKDMQHQGKAIIYSIMGAISILTIANCSHCGCLDLKQRTKNISESISDVISHTGVTNNVINGLSTSSCAS